MATHKLRKTIIKTLSRVFVIGSQDQATSSLKLRLVHDSIDLGLLICQSGLV